MLVLLSKHQIMKQIHDLVVSHPIKVDYISESERKQSMESLMYSVQKRCGRIKQELEYISKDYTISPTVSHDATIITGVIEAKHQCIS